jgi:hypothetical protein
MTALAHLDPRRRIVIAAICSVVGVLVAQHPDSQPETRAFWLAVVVLLYRRVLRRSAVAYMVVSLFAAFGAALFAFATVADSIQHVVTLQQVVEASLACMEAALLWSRPVAEWVGEPRRARLVKQR